MTILQVFGLTAVCFSVWTAADNQVDVQANSIQSFGDINDNYKFDVRFTSEVHHAVKPLEARFRASESMNAKFRYL